MNAWDIYTTTTTRKREREKHLKAKKNEEGKNAPNIYTPMPVITNIVPYLIIFSRVLVFKTCVKGSP